jgi:hypothetical protein
MIAAIYARKSTDQNVADEEKSVTRQVERGEDLRDGEAAGVSGPDQWADPPGAR